MSEPLWTPSPERIESANLTAFVRHARERWGVDARDHAELHT